MTLEEEYRISCYEQLTCMGERKEIYLVKNVEDGRLYLKKKISRYNSDIYKRLYEVKVKNIPELVLCVEDDNGLTVIEEYIHGKSLEELLREEGTLSEDRAVEIMIEVLNILSTLHAMKKPIIHRDIKPSNIMISNDGVVKLIDFDAAREWEKNAVCDTYFMGTMQYAAPEQYGFGQSDERTDIYGCGVTLNVMLTGKTPREKAYGGRLGKIIEKCVRLEPETRYHNVEELIRELKKYQYETGRDKKMFYKPRNSFDMENTSRSSGFTTDDKVPDMHEGKERISSWLPVGFRTHTRWKSVLASVGYAFIILVTFAGKWYDKEGKPFGVAMSWLYRITTLALCFGYIAVIGNYRGVRDRFIKVKKNIVTDILLCVLYLVIYSILVCIMAVIVQDFI